MFVERWTIDEIGDGVVRVLAARSMTPESLAPLAERSRAATAPAALKQSSAEVMAVELGSATPTATPATPATPAAGADTATTTAEQSWTDEQDSVLEEELVVAFVQRFRERVPGGVERDLRETDVFWVVVEGDGPARSLSDAAIRRSDTKAVLAAYAAVDPVVRDMTAPARQASKVLYHDAFRKSEERS